MVTKAIVYMYLPTTELRLLAMLLTKSHDVGPGPLTQLTEFSQACVVVKAAVSTHLTTTDLSLLAVMLSNPHDGAKAHLHSSLTSARHGHKGNSVYAPAHNSFEVAGHVTNQLISCAHGV